MTRSFSRFTSPQWHHQSLGWPALMAILAWGLSIGSVQAADPAPDFGPNVLVFDPTSDPADIQTKCDEVFKSQEAAQFGDARKAIFFKPGTYPVTVNVGFYTQVYGLGKSPDDVTLNGGFHCDAKWSRGNGTVNFWRGVENFTAVDNTSKGLMWAVSQAAPMRRMHIKGDLWLFQPDGQPNWTSGGFMADTQVEGKVISGSQQQWLSRNSEWGSWSNGVWNMVFLGCQGSPEGTWPDKPYTTIDKTPVIREKPFLYVEGDGSYKVFVPGERKDSANFGWADNPVGSALPLTSFYIAKSDGDTAATINAALAKGQNLLLTPGIYKLDAALQVTHPDTIVLGLGMATLSPQKGTAAIEVADVNGVRIANLILDAGPVNSPYLLQVGDPKGRAAHANDPTIIYDLFARIGGGADLGVATTAVIINSNDVIGDHAWLWRADHGNLVGWDSNKSENGLIVNGDNVTYYGLFVEHFQKYQTLWTGENGRDYFYQCEMPYDPPTQDDWQHTAQSGSVKGYAGYKVADTVKTHETWGMGIYCVFLQDNIFADSAIEAPKSPNVKFHNALTFRLSGKTDNSGINSVINGTGDAATKQKAKSLVLEYPDAP